MSEREEDLITKVFNQNQEMFKVLNDLKTVIVGDEIYKRPGILDRITTLEKIVDDHDTFQNKQQYFVGWTGQLIRGAWIVGAVVVGWLISLFF